MSTPDSLLEESVTFAARILGDLQAAQIQTKKTPHPKVLTLRVGDLDKPYTATDKAVPETFRRVVDKMMQDGGLKPLGGNHWLQMKINQYVRSEMVTSDTGIRQFVISAWAAPEKLRAALSVNKDRLPELCREALTEILGPAPKTVQPLAQAPWRIS
jgi:hypothetical protein